MPNRDLKLVGVDVGFSNRRRSNAIAIYDSKSLAVTNTNAVERDALLSRLTDADIVAIDAPILPLESPDYLSRSCEAAFVRGAFQKRCKPGLSHIRGTGRELRAHGALAAAHSRTTNALASCGFPRVLEAAVIEAFPNAFLGVVLADSVFGARAVARGGKFDWLYDRCIEQNMFNTLCDDARLGPEVARAFIDERDHDRRSALVCLLTAAFAAIDRYVAVGDAAAGYFYLPPRRLWAEWAWNELRSTALAAGAAIHEHS